MNKYKCVLAYDGTAYAGWQIQPNAKTVEGVFRATFERAFDMKPHYLLGASRTDAGVHALGHVVCFKTTLDIAPDKIKWVLNNALPNDIVIQSLELADDNFHPLADVTCKTYWYHFFLDRPLPFVARYGLYQYQSVDLKKLHTALQQFVGMHDFRAFCTLDDQEKNTVRTVDTIEIEYVQEYKAYRVIFKAQKFLRYMIRRMMGAALHIASHDDLSVDCIARVLAEKNPNHRLPNAQAHGLTLHSIIYKKGAHEKAV